jgi:hypothetical protein
MARTLGRLVRTVARWLPLLALGAGAWLAFAGRAQGGPVDDDGAPQGAIAFFTGGACPAGWATAPTVQGRLVVAVADGGSAGVQVGSPLGDQEDRQHQHTYTGTVTLGPKDIAAANGSNDNGAASQTYTVTGTTGKAASALPFVQVQPCVKQ